MTDRRRSFAVVASLIVALALGMLLAGCSAKEPVAESAPPDAPAAIEKPTLEQYLAADTKTGRFTLDSVLLDGTKSTMDGEFWVEGRKFRYTLNKDGKPFGDIISPDGKTAYLVKLEDEYCEPSPASVDRYLLEFTEPAAEAVEDGTDPATGAMRIVYTVDRTDDMKGADNPWYTKDIVYLVKDGQVIGVISRGNSEKSADEDLAVSRRIFSDLTVGAPIPAATFELPYPIKPAE